MHLRYQHRLAHLKRHLIPRQRGELLGRFINRSGLKKLVWSLLVAGLVMGLSVSFLAQAAQPVLQTTPGAGGSRVTATVKMDDNPEINVRSGPGVDYELVGKLREGDQVPALGRSVGGDWVQIMLPSAPGGVAWVYTYLVTLSGDLPIVEPPPTPTPRVTPTIDPTLAAQFIVDAQPTRLPTFTPPPPLALPTYTIEEPAETASKAALMYAMIGLAAVGLLGMLLSFVRVR